MAFLPWSHPFLLSDDATLEWRSIIQKRSESLISLLDIFLNLEKVQYVAHLIRKREHLIPNSFSSGHKKVEIHK